MLFHLGPQPLFKREFHKIRGPSLDPYSRAFIMKIPAKRSRNLQKQSDVVPEAWGNSSGLHAMYVWGLQRKLLLRSLCM